jgi:hypothetical protein
MPRCGFSFCRSPSRSNTAGLLRILAIVAALDAPVCAEDKDKKDEGWTELLSAKTKSLDEHWTTTGNWTFKDGVATLTPRAGEKGWSRWSAYLWSKKKYGEFEIEFEYKVEKKGNSGFYFRVGDVNDPVAQGIEVQIYDSAGKPEDAELTDRDAGGIIPGLKPHWHAAKPAGEWNKMTVTHRWPYPWGAEQHGLLRHRAALPIASARRYSTVRADSETRHSALGATARRRGFTFLPSVKNAISLS